MITLALFYLMVFCSKESDLLPSKLDTFECGFERFSSCRVPFSIRFFIIAIVFLVFDVEVVLILPAPLTFMLTPYSY